MLRRIFKETIIYGIAGATSRLIGILLVPLYTRVFNPSQFGMLDILLTTSTVLVLVSGLQVEAGVGRSYYEAQQKGRRGELVGTGIILCALGAVFCWLAMLVGHPFIPRSWLGNHGTYVLAVGLAILPSELLNLAQTILRLERMSKQFLILSIGDILTSSCFSVLAVVYWHFGIGGILWSLCVSKLIWIGIGAVWLKSFYDITFSGSYAKEILIYSLPTIPSGIVGWVQNSANRYILAGAMSLFEVGILGLSIRIASAVAMLLTAFRMAWYPYSIEIMNSEGFREKCARMLDIYWLVGFPICAMVSALGGLIVSILASKSYMPAGRLVGFLAMGILWSGAPQIVGLGSDYVRKTYLGLIAYVLGAGINIAVLLATVKRWGLISAGLASLTSYIGTTIVFMALSQRQYRMPFRSYVIFCVAVCSIVLSFWCYLGPAPHAGLIEVLADAAKKSAIAVAMSVLVVSMAASKGDKEKAVGMAVSVYKRIVA